VLKLPVPARFKLENGLTVFLVEQHSLPIVAANVVVLSGSERNPVERPGLASFTAEMLDEGTKKRPALQIADDAEQIGARLSTRSTTDLSYVAVHALKKNAEAALDLAADVLLNPEFPANEIDRIRNDRLTEILQQRDEPSILAAKVFYSAVYGPDHPYGYTELGTAESNKAITRDDLLKFWEAGYVPENAALVVAGDVSEAEVRALAEKYFGNWRGAHSRPEPPSATDLAGRRVVIVDRPASPQTSLRIGHVGVARANPDYVAIDVMNTALGGLFSSRINSNLREKHGYTYGASSTFAYRRGPGPFVIGTGVRTDVTAPAVSEIFREIERMRSSQLTAEELATAKDSIARSLPGFFETTPQAASSVAQLYVHGLPLDYYRKLPEQTSSVSATDVQRVAEKYLKPMQTVVVAVGDRKKIDPELKKLNLGPIEPRDLDGRPIGEK